MNTLSSILKFLGNTLGADPSTLTTTNKTLVSAINEVKSIGAIKYKDVTVTFGSAVGADNRVYTASASIPSVTGYTEVSCTVRGGSNSGYDRCAVTASINGGKIIVHAVGDGTARTVQANVRVFYVKSTRVSAAS